MSSVLLEWLARASVLVTLLIPIAWTCSVAMRRLIGARAAVAAWFLVLPAITPQISFLAAVTPFSDGGLIEPVALEALRVGTGTSAPGWLSPMLVLLWLAGAVGFGAWQALHQQRFESILRSGVAFAGLAAQVRPRLARQGLPSRIPLRFSDTVPAPMVVGAFPPRLYLPAGVRTPDEILAHEIAHIRHHDPFWRLVASAMRCTFWFLPWVHIAWAKFGDAQELAADEAVIAGLDRQGRYRYARLLAAACGAHRTEPVLGWLTHSLVKERIKMIGMTPPFSRSLRAALVVVGAAAVSITVAIASPGSDERHEPLGEHPDQLSPEAMLAKAQLVAMQEREPIEGDGLSPVVRVLPRYPRQAADQGVTGHVKMEATLTKNGYVTAIEVIEAEPVGIFDAQAVEAFSQWRFAPISPDGGGKAQPVRIRQQINFVLD